METITGGTGIVGVHLLLERTAAGERVRALHRRHSDRSIVARVFRHYRADADALLARIEWVEGDLEDVLSLEDALAGVERVYHAAALVSFDPRDSRRLVRVNTEGTANLVNAALACGVRRLCHVSSTAAIGHAPAGMLRHEDLPWEPDRYSSPYALTKHAAELEVARGIAEGLDAVIVNPCIVIGPGAPGRSSMAMVERLRRGTRFFPPGSNAVVDARDVAACCVALMEKGATGERYLLVGENVSYRRLFTVFAEAFGNKPPMHRLPPLVLGIAWRMEWLRSLLGGRPIITRHTARSVIEVRAYANTKVSAALGFTFRPLEEMVANTAAFVRAY
jgi:nucleoside-diphosphate-sugar epimerase